MALTSADITNLTTARTNFAAKLAEISANPLPSYTIGNVSMDFPAFCTFLREQIEALDVQIQEATDGRGAWEIRSRAIP